MRLTAKAAIQIQKPIEEVFEAIVDPVKITQYFISESSGRLEEGREIQWKFAEFPDYAFPGFFVTFGDRSIINRSNKMTVK